MIKVASLPRLVVIALGAIALTCLYLFLAPLYDSKVVVGDSRNNSGGTAQQQVYTTDDGPVPTTLIDLGIYKSQDFRNEAHIQPPFWVVSNDNATASSSLLSSSSSLSWGPCYPPRRPVHWDYEINQVRDNNSNDNNNNSPTVYPDYRADNNHDDLSNLCRPGFLIIGAGKCGTSSLYHYLVDHPRVLPAKQKQIHYFKYYASRSLQWYYSNFPTTANFLASGGLLTGEASPGYLPYPNVANLVYSRLPGVRIIMVGRNPIERMYSSYLYNYVTPMVEQMRKGRVHNVLRGQGNDEYYQQYLFSFQEMVVAELAQLQKCLHESNGTAISGAQKEWGKYAWVQAEISRRQEAGLPRLADVDGHCYGNRRVSSKVLRVQWTDLQAAHPEKVIMDRNTHLTQSIIGRSLYVLPLEWWYARMGSQAIYFVCTEELSDMSGEGVARVANFLGLPAFNFSSTISKGAFNVGGHRGYDTEVSWDVIANSSHHASVQTEIPLSDDVLQQVKDFLQPYNERLFQLTGRRCEGW